MNKHKKIKKHEEVSYPKDFLPSGGATSAVTGGHPEDMNEMPADTDPNDEAPVYDGSSARLKSSRQDRAVSRASI